MAEDLVLDDELLYRSVENSPEKYSIVDGKVRFSSTVFNDRSQKISVDRSTLRNSPEQSKLNPSHGVVYLVAEEVRNITTIKNEGADPPFYAIDVIPRPIFRDNPNGDSENLAHAQIEPNPEFATSSRFKKLKEALLILINQRTWLVDPS